MNDVSGPIPQVKISHVDIINENRIFTVKCPYCETVHRHIGGNSKKPVKTYLTHRIPDCATIKQEASRGYILSM